MKRVLFVIPATPLAENYSGAATRFLQDFRALVNLATEVHVLRFHIDGNMETVYQFEESDPRSKDFQKMATSWIEVPLPVEGKPLSRKSLFLRSMHEPVEFQFPQVRFIKSTLEEQLFTLLPSLLWVGDAHLAAAVYEMPSGIAVIYSHTDLLYRVRDIRMQRKTWKQRWQLWVCRRAELKIIRSNISIMTGSYTEAKRLRELGNPNVVVVPTAYESFPPLSTQSITTVPRIIHLGSLETTSNRIGLEAYLRQVHPIVTRQCLADLWIIGQSNRVKPPLSSLLEESSIILKGYIANLNTVLRPFDLSILPYEYDTGYRTKLPLLFAYGQVVVTTRAAIAGTYTPELEDVCIIVDRVEDFSDQIVRLVNNSHERERIGRAARTFFERFFTHEAVLWKYQHLIESMRKI